MSQSVDCIEVRGATEHNLKDLSVSIERGSLTVITGVSGSGKSSLAFDTILAEAQRRFLHTLSHYSRQFLDIAARPAVRSLSGLSPAIALAQNETPPSRRASVATLTDLGELIGVLLARFGDARCPTHDQPTTALTPAEIAEHLLVDSALGDGMLAVCAPVAAAKKGSFKKELLALAERGYLKAFIDGQVVSLAEPPALAAAEKHTIKLIIDYVARKESARPRLVRAIETALAEGSGHGEWFGVDAKGMIKPEVHGAFASSGGCPACGYSWPRLDARHFSANSLGRCPSCAGLGQAGVTAGTTDDADDVDDEDREVDPDGDNEGEDAPPLAIAACPDCAGTGLAPGLRSIRLGGLSALDLHAMAISEADTYLTQLLLSPKAGNPALRRVAEEAQRVTRKILDVGLGYLTLARRIRSLSGGEAQRLKLAGILTDTLRGVLYVLDEPSQGLHGREVAQLMVMLRALTERGNTVIVVDHDEMVMRAADWIIDLGPGGGARGGRLMAKFRPSEARGFVSQSATARFLVSPSQSKSALASAASSPAGAPRGALVIEGANLHNLRIDTVRFPLGALSVVTGVSGAGKSSLVMHTLASNLLQGSGAKSWRHCHRLTGAEAVQTVAVIDRRPLGKSLRSIPASYLDVFGELRQLFAEQTDAQILGLTARAFSLSVEGGRCPECKGRGEQSLSMRFLADARVRCSVCHGRRFQSAVLGVRYLGLSMAEVLDLSLDEALALFKNHRRIVQKLEPAVALGLGYLHLGQPSASLSGGEAQRLKLVPYLTKRHGDGSLIILDEPTAGLHFEDVAKLTLVFRQLVAAGTTVIAIEHNPDVIRAADWVIELGPGAAAAGGRLVRQGPP